LNVAIVVGALSWTTTARVARAEFLRLRDQEFATAARAIGAGNLYLIYRVILPNALAPLIIMASLSVANAILVVAGLSFLGLVDPNQSSWGLILAFNRGSILTDLWPTTLAGLAIFITVLGVGLVADGLNDALNPRRRGR
jgi:peptide/nickel transport system permease protein